MYLTPLSRFRLQLFLFIFVSFYLDVLLWDPWSDQALVFKSKPYRDVIKQKRPDLIKAIRPSPLWPHLLALNVLNRETKDEIEVCLFAVFLFMFCQSKYSFDIDVCESKT